MYFTCKGRGLKIHEKSLTDRHIYKWKPSDDWHPMSDTDYAFNWMYCTQLRTVLKSIHLCSLSYVNIQFNYSITQQDIELRYIAAEDYSLLESDAVQNNRWGHTNFTEKPDVSKRWCQSILLLWLHRHMLTARYSKPTTSILFSIFLVTPRERRKSTAYKKKSHTWFFHTSTLFFIHNNYYSMGKMLYRGLLLSLPIATIICNLPHVRLTP